MIASRAHQLASKSNADSQGGPLSGIVITARDRRRIKLAGQILGGVTGTVAGVTALSAGLLMRPAAAAPPVIPMGRAPPPRGGGGEGAKIGGEPPPHGILGGS